MQDLEKIKERGTLKIGLNIEEGTKGAPWAWIDEQTKLYLGFEIDIVKEICQQLFLKAEFIPVESYKVISGLLNNQYDVCIGAIKPESNVPELSYSTPYYHLTQRIVHIAQNTIYDLSDLREKNVGVLSNSMGEFIINHENTRLPSQIKLKKFEDVLELFSELQFNNIDAIFIDSPVALWYSKTNIKARMNLSKLSYKSGSYSLAIKTQNKKLTQTINKAIESIDLNNILDKYGLWDETQKNI